MHVHELVKALNALDPNAKVLIAIDDIDQERGEGFFEPAVMPDDSDGMVIINLGADGWPFPRWGPTE